MGLGKEGGRVAREVGHGVKFDKGEFRLPDVLGLCCNLASHTYLDA